MSARRYKGKNLFKIAEKRKKSVAQVAKAAAEKAISRRAESKFFNHYQYLGTLDSNGYIMDISAVAVGTSDSQRNGDKITPTGLYVEHYCLAAGNTVFTAGSGLYRVIVFRWRPDSIPTPTDILQVVGTYGVISKYNHDQRKQFNVLSDTSHAVTAAYTPHMKKYIKLPPKQIAYNGGATTGSNRLYILLVNDDNVITGSPPQPVVTTRLLYQDM